MYIKNILGYRICIDDTVIELIDMVTCYLYEFTYLIIAHFEQSHQILLIIKKSRYTDLYHFTV